MKRFPSIWRIVALARKEATQLRRDRFGMRLLVLLPVIQLLVIAPALDREVRHISWTYIDEDQSVESRSLLATVNANSRFDLQELPHNAPELRHMLDQGTVSLGLLIPKGFSRQLEDASTQLSSGIKPIPATVHFVVDGQDAATSSIASGYAQAIVQQWTLQQIRKRIEAQGVHLDDLIPVHTREALLFNPELRSPWYLVPGLAVLLVTVVVALTMAFSIVKEKEAGTLEQLLVTPVGALEIIAGKAIPMMVVGALEMAFTLALASLVYSIPMNGSWIALTMGILLYTITSVALGLLVSAVVGTQQQALLLLWFCMIFFALTGGVMMPWESMPTWTQQITEGNAARHFLDLVRAILLCGAQSTELTTEFAKLSAIAAIEVLLATLLFRRRE